MQQLRAQIYTHIHDSAFVAIVAHLARHHLNEHTDLHRLFA